MALKLLVSQSYNLTSPVVSIQVSPVQFAGSPALSLFVTPIRK